MSTKIPNLYPHKHNLIEELAMKKKASLRDDVKERIGKKNKKALADTNEAIENGCEKVGLNKFVFEESKEEVKEKPIDKSKKATSEHLKAIVHQSNVVLVTVDARDPVASRNIPYEEEILAAGKTLVLVLTKADLARNASNWLGQLRKERQTVLFSSKPNKSKNTGDLMLSTAPLGGSELLGAISGAFKGSPITLGVIGYPLTGKQTVINSLIEGMKDRADASSLYAISGKGTVLAKKSDNLILRHVVSADDLNNPTVLVTKAIEQLGQNTFVVAYRTSAFDSTEMFLGLVAKHLGTLIKGGLPDYDKTARKVLGDIFGGKIKYFTEIK